MQRAQGFVQNGNVTVLTGGQSSSNVMMGSFPLATITVNITGGGLATIFSDNINTPLSNPFTSTSTGFWEFYAANGRYDIQFSGGGLSAPVTFGDNLFDDPAVAQAIVGTTGAFSSNVTVGGTLIVTGATTLNAGTLNGTFAGNPTLSGNVLIGGTLGVTGVFSGSSGAFAGTLTAGITNGAITVSKQCGVSTDLGVCINNAVAACAVLPCKLWVDPASPLTMSTSPNIPKGFVLEFAPGIYTLAATLPLAHRGAILNGNGCQFNYNQDTGNAAIFVGKNLSGTVNCNGTTTITQASGSQFTNFDQGDQIFVGTGSFNVASVTDPTHLVVTGTCPNQSGTAYSGVIFTGLGLGSFDDGMTIRDLIINYTGAGTNASNTGMQVNLMNDPSVSNVTITNFATGKGLVILGSQLGQYLNIRSNVNKSALVLDNATAGTVVTGANKNFFISPQVVQSPAGGNPVLIQGVSFGNRIIQGDFEGNQATVMGTIAGSAFSNTIEDCDHEKNGDGTASSADWKVTAVPSASQPGQYFDRNRFTSAVANTPNTGIICTGAGVLCYLRDNQWQAGDPYSNSWTFSTSATGSIQNNTSQGFTHTDPVGFSVNQNGGWGTALQGLAPGAGGQAAGDPPVIPNNQAQSWASAANNAAVPVIKLNGSNVIIIDPNGQTVGFGSTAQASKFLTNANCSSTGGTCAAASAGNVGITNPATTVTVATTAVGANSQIFVFEDSTLGTKLGATCNATLGRSYMITTRTPGASFIITASATPAANTACLSYLIVN